MIIKRVGKLFHVVDGVETLLITTDFSEAQRLMPEDKKEYVNKELDIELQLESYDAFEFAMKKRIS